MYGIFRILQRIGKPVRGALILIPQFLRTGVIEMKPEFKVGDIAHLSVNYTAGQGMWLKCDDAVTILKVYKADEKHAGGYVYATDCGEIPQNKLYSKALWEKYTNLKKQLKDRGMKL